MSRIMIPESRSLNPELFHIWQLIRTHTAALFFVVAGMIFTYLLLQDQNESPFKNNRARKGLRRGLKLLVIGFILHLDVRYLYRLKFSNYIFTIHVLQSIALVLIIIVILYYLSSWLKRIKLEWMFILIAFLSLIGSHWVANTDGSNFPILVQILFGFPIGDSHYSSAFPLMPWLGYGLGGAFLGVLFHRRSEWLESTQIGRNLVIMGVGLLFIPYLVFYTFDQFSPANWLKITDAGYDFSRLGRVLIFIGLIAWLTNYRDLVRTLLYRLKSALKQPITTWILLISVLIFVSLLNFLDLPILIKRSLHILTFISSTLLAIRFIRWNYDLFIKLGQQTLPIYILHAIILYGGFTGIGLDTYFAKELHPWEAIIGAALFITFFVYFIKYLDRFPLLKRILK